MSRISIAAAAVAFVAATANAGGTDALQVEFSVDGGPADVYNPVGSDNGNGFFNFADDILTPDYNFSYNINAKPDPIISGNIVVVNNSLFTHTYSATFILSISPAVLPFSVASGSIAGGLTTDLDGGTLSTNGVSLYRAYTDGVEVQGLIADPFSVGKVGAGSVGIGPEDFTGLAGGPVSNTIAINLTFTLTAGDQASFTSVFVVEAVPAPAGLALLGLAGVFGGRRRRA
jgi:MYXO-CTERM domain-containing protein